MTIDSGGSPFAAGPSAAVIYNAEGPEKAVLDSGTAAVVVDLSPTHDIGDDRELIVSDLDGDGRTDLIWYGPGEGPDAIWYGHRAGA